MKGEIKKRGRGGGLALIATTGGKKRIGDVPPHSTKGRPRGRLTLGLAKLKKKSERRKTLKARD